MSKYQKVNYEWDSNTNQVYNGRQQVSAPPAFETTQPFMQYEMHFLKHPIVVELGNYLLFEKTNYDYKIKDMSDVDKEMLDRVLQYINPSLKLSPTELYINGKKALSLGGENIEVDGYKFKASVLIQGYKENNMKQIRPIWRLHAVSINVKA